MPRPKSIRVRPLAAQQLGLAMIGLSYCWHVTGLTVYCMGFVGHLPSVRLTAPAFHDKLSKEFDFETGHRKLECISRSTISSEGPHPASIGDLPSLSFLLVVVYCLLLCSKFRSSWDHSFLPGQLFLLAGKGRSCYHPDCVFITLQNLGIVDFKNLKVWNSESSVMYYGKNIPSRIHNVVES